MLPLGTHCVTLRMVELVPFMRTYCFRLARFSKQLQVKIIDLICLQFSKKKVMSCYSHIYDLPHYCCNIKEQLVLHCKSVGSTWCSFG